MILLLHTPTKAVFLKKIATDVFRETCQGIMLLKSRLSSIALDFNEIFLPYYSSHEQKKIIDFNGF